MYNFKYEKKVLKSVLVIMLALLSTQANAQVQLGARPDGASNSNTNSVTLVYNAFSQEEPVRRREAGFVTQDMQGSTSRGINRGINRGVARGINRGVARGINRGANRGINRGVNRSEEELEYAELPRIIAPLAPLRTGVTSTAQPELFWYISDPWPGSIFFTLNESKTAEPVLELQLEPEKDKKTHPSGMHSINLAKYQVTLKKDTEYEWFVYIVVDPMERSADFLASATIIHKKMSDNLEKLIDNSNDDEKYVTFAKQGYWYDAIEILSNQIISNPEQKLYRNHRAALLEQVKMPLVAKYDK